MSSEPPRSLERRCPSALVVFAAMWLIEAALEHVAVEWWIRRQIRAFDRGLAEGGTDIFRERFDGPDRGR